MSARLCAGSVRNAGQQRRKRGWLHRPSLEWTDNNTFDLLENGEDYYPRLFEAIGPTV